jgi:hypothetical protein
LRQWEPKASPERLDASASNASARPFFGIVPVRW